MVKSDDILNAATKLFADKGYEGTTMQNIAEAVGLQKQSLYAHFKSKDKIYFQVIQDQIDYFTGRLDHCMENLRHDTTDVLLAGVFKCIVHAFSCHERLMIFKRALLDRKCDAEAGAYQEIGCCIEKMIRESLYGIISKRHERLSDPENFRPFYTSYIMTIQGYLDKMVMGQHDEVVWNEVWRNCWNGLRSAI
jgi:AcrR family transcriptional regulator